MQRRQYLTSSQRYTPLHFTDRMGGAVAGRPIAIRFIDNRTIDGQDRPQ